MVVSTGQYAVEDTNIYIITVIINPQRACAARVTVLGLCVCVSVCLSVTMFSATTRNNAPNKIYQRLQRDMSKVLKMVFSLKMLRSGVTAISAYAAKSAIFFSLVSMRIPAHAHVVCSLLECRAVVPTMRLRVYSGRFVIFSNLNSLEGNMRLRKVCPQYCTQGGQ